MSAIPVKETLKYVNQARTNPSAFAKYVKQQLDSFLNNTTLPLLPGCNYSTNEGKGAWTQAYQFLLKQKPMQGYELNQGLSLAAEDHAIDMAQTNIFGHTSSDGSSFTDRITKRCGKAFGSSGENIGSDFKIEGRDHALQTVMGLIIDDGVSSRGHRKNIFSPDFKYIGIASRVQEDKIITVMVFHSNKLPTLSGTANNSNAGSKLSYQEEKKPKGNGKGWNDDDFQKKFSEMGFGNSGGSKHGSLGSGFGGQLSKASNASKGERKVVSKSTHTKTSTINGVKTVVKTTKTKWSDGTQEQQVQQTSTK